MPLISAYMRFFLHDPLITRCSSSISDSPHCERMFLAPIRKQSGLVENCSSTPDCAVSCYSGPLRTVACPNPFGRNRVHREILFLTLKLTLTSFLFFFRTTSRLGPTFRFDLSASSGRPEKPQCPRHMYEKNDETFSTEPHMR